VEGRLAELTALDAARAELMSVVTHELRTPLAVVRAYVELLGGAAASNSSAEEWQTSALEQVSRLDHLVDSILASVRGEGLTGLARSPFDASLPSMTSSRRCELLLRSHAIRWDRPRDR
jgi:signal transduction histidine kinase